MAEQARLTDQSAIKTYRYLRIGMIGVVLLLAVSVGIERAEAGGWQTSISAYYYTPVRAVFVGGLMAIGLCLIVIKGSHPWEDVSLNIAGMLAPVVALVPTSTVRESTLLASSPDPVRDGELAEWVRASIDNNIKALLIAGFAGLLVAALIASVANRSVLAVAQVGDPGMRRGLAGALALLVAGALAFGYWDGFYTHGHTIAAFTMFGFLALAAAINAWQWQETRTEQWYFGLYVFIALAMVAAALVLLLFARHWDYKVLVLEIVEIALFATFWLVQTREHWNERVEPGPTAT